MSHFSKIYSVLKRYLANCNIHGIRYIVEDNLHWTERLFWLMTCSICWYGCMVMVKGSLDGYYNRPVAFTAESTYLDWKIDFPSVSICTQGHPSARKIAGDLYRQKFGTIIKSPHAWTWLFSYTLPKGNTKTIEQLSLLTSDNIVHIYKESSLKFNCCEKFLPLKTAAGICFVFNSRHTNADVFPNEFTMNQDTGVGSLIIGLDPNNFVGDLSTTKVSIDNNLAITTAVGNSDKEIDILKNKVNPVYFTLEDTFNEPGLKHVPPERRRCRFPEETEKYNLYRLYSNSGCLIQLQMDNMVKFCGCVSHLFPYPAGSAVCNYTGVECLMNNEEAIMAKADAGKVCLPDCEGTVLRIYQNMYVIRGEISAFKVSQGIRLELLALPTSRYRRYVVRSLLDLVVAIGSTASLFMGAGILSLVEIPYWLLLRHSSLLVMLVDELNIGVPGSEERVTMMNVTNTIFNSSHILTPTEPEILTLEDVREVVAQAEGSEAKLISYSIQPYSVEKLGFLASHKQLKVQITKAGSSSEETKVYFVKAVPHEVPTQAEYICETKIFIKEVLFFNYIVPELEKSYPGDRWGPRCFLAHNEVIVLEELRSSGFSMREKLFDEESVNAALSALARMHAASLGAEARLGKPLNELYPEAFQETGFQEYGKQFMWYKAGVKVAVAVAEQLGLDPSQIPQACQEVFEANKPSRSLQNVVSHADPWSNNFMFNNGKPPLCYVVDFQLVRYSPPGYDIAMLLYLTASQKLRETRGEAMVRHYYTTLCETLGMYDPPVEPPSFSSILKGMEEQKLGALVTAMIYLPTVLLDGALGATVMNNPVTYAKYVYNDRRDVVLSNMKRDVLYDTRIKEVVTELHEFSQRLHTLPVPC